MKKLSVLFSVLLILTFVISACAPAATPTPEAETEEAAPVEVTTEEVATEEVATEEVATEAVMTEEVATEAPAVTEGAAPAAAAGWCSGTNIVFFPGGTPGGPFETVVYNGAVQAAADTGANVEYVWSDWNPEKMITQFSEAMATSPNGIAVMGHPGTEAFAPLVDEAESKGIIVTSMNVQLADLQSKYGGTASICRCASV
jgi:ABC-type sugar transport system substrate-binding protein